MRSPWPDRCLLGAFSLLRFLWLVLEQRAEMRNGLKPRVMAFPLLFAQRAAARHRWTRSTPMETTQAPCTTACQRGRVASGGIRRSEGAQTTFIQHPCMCMKSTAGLHSGGVYLCGVFGAVSVTVQAPVVGLGCALGTWTASVAKCEDAI